MKQLSIIIFSILAIGANAQSIDLSVNKSQYQPDYITLGNITTLAPTVNNIIHWLSISGSAWELEMKNTPYETTGVADNDVYYSFLIKNVGSYAIARNPNGFIIIQYHSIDGSIILNDLVNSLDNYYVSSGDGNNIYSLYRDGYNYTLGIRRQNGNEMVTALRKKATK
jgi:hypothetical protein